MTTRLPPIPKPLKLAGPNYLPRHRCPGCGRRHPCHMLGVERPRGSGKFLTQHGVNCNHTGVYYAIRED